VTTAAQTRTLAIERALIQVSRGLAPDGFSLTFEESEDGRVVVTLEATAEACLDCLVPDEMLLRIIAMKMADEGALDAKIELRKLQIHDQSTKAQ
jgi:hypothetical protein